MSGSVAAAAQFLLLLLYSLREVMSDLRAFAFSSHLEDVDDLLRRVPVRGGGRPRIMERIGFRPTDYGRTLRDLEDGYRDAHRPASTTLSSFSGMPATTGAIPETAVARPALPAGRSGSSG